MNDSKSISAGQLLISEPFLPDYNFERSVVLLTDHRDPGTIGFILNRPIATDTNELLPGRFSVNFPCYYGGPVETSGVHFIHCCPIPLSESIPIVNGFYRGGNVDQLADWIERKLVKPEWFRFFMGYSGWDNDQLQSEVDEGSWLYGDTMTNEIFNQDPLMLWKNQIYNLGPEYHVMVNAPKNPLWN